MKRYWEMARSRIDNMSLRERAMIFAAAAFVLVTLINSILLDPLLIKQRNLSAQVVQQQEKMRELQAMMGSLSQAKRDDEQSPLRVRLAQLKQQLVEQNNYLQNRGDRLVTPDKMGRLMEQVLSQNDRLQLIALDTLPVSLLLENPQAENATPVVAANVNSDQKQIFKHGVQITVRGSYADLLQYLAALEKLPARMLWGEVKLRVDQYPDSLLTLTLYTLSLDKTWLAL
jgi:MSHA biogenesis protein MshJ